MTEIIFTHHCHGWMAQLGAITLSFPGWKAGDIYRYMLAEQPHLRVGFAAAGFGMNTLRIYGPVVWMKTAEEQEHV